MEITFDPGKNARNIAERGLACGRVWEIDWESAISEEDVRKNYGERRVRVIGLIGWRLHAAVVTMHVISLRKANAREGRRYAQSQK